nr:LysR family transcriptional regulator [Acidovorax sp. ACV01]
MEAFHWAVRLGSFQAAAIRLHTTQSAISKRIAELEAIFDEKLFDRSRRRPQATPKGHVLARSAEEMLALNQKMLASKDGLAGYQGVFRFGATELIGQTWLPRLVHRIKDAYPAVDIELDVDLGGTLFERLARGLIDLALIPGPLWGKQFDALPLKSLECSWMASPALGVPRRVLSAEELSGYPVLSKSTQSGITQLYSTWFQQNGFVGQRTVMTNSFAALGELTMAGLGISQLPNQYYREQVRQGRLVRIRSSPALPHVKYFAVYRKESAGTLAERIGRLAQSACDFRHPMEYGGQA